MEEKRKRRPWLDPWQSQTLILSAGLKIALIPTYHSTDFEVHRHWLALTNTLPLSQWYFDETSQWTLDYPPFFAYFSYLLSIPAKIWDPRIVDLNGGLEYDGWKCLTYMRATVICSELVLAGALFALSRQTAFFSSNDEHDGRRMSSLIAAALLLHPGLIIVDHIHFQYNGFLLGILLWSIWAARQDRPLLCAFLFSTLLNFKHIFVYIAPAYFFYLLQAYIIKGSNSVSFSGASERLFALATITLIPFAFSIVPLALSGFTSDAPAGPIGILAQMLRRLFPFSRGLNHAYWAANAWALYTFADRALVKLMPNKVIDVGASASRGLIGDIQFSILPQIAAGHCFLLTFAFTLLFSIRLFVKPTKTSFVQAITLFGLTSFLFGFHVHEKAILLPLIPLTLLSSLNYFYVRMTLILSVCGIVALFPLLYEVKETPVKMVYSALWTLVTFRAMFTFHFRPTPSNWDLVLHYLENLYLLGFVPLQLFVSVLHPLWTTHGITELGREASKVAMAKAASVSDSIVDLASAASSRIAPAESVSSWVGRGNEGLNISISSAVGQAAEAMLAESKTAVQASLDTASKVVNNSSNLLSHIASIGHPAQSGEPSTMEFLPLMLTSVYCALGVTLVWLRLGHRFLTTNEEASSPTQVQITTSSPKKRL